jgi:hypothetical protein
MQAFFVPGAGFEPARPFEQTLLRRQCLPFHHPGMIRDTESSAFEPNLPQTRMRTIYLVTVRSSA